MKQHNKALKHQHPYQFDLCRENLPTPPSGHRCEAKKRTTDSDRAKALLTWGRGRGTRIRVINDGSSAQLLERTHFLSSVQSSWETLCAAAAGTFWSLAYLKNTHPHSSVIMHNRE